MAVHIEQATAADIPTLSELLSVLFAQEEEFTPDPRAQQEGLALIIADSNIGAIFLAREDHAVVGMVNLLFTVSTALGARVALLEDMVVAPHRRGRGIGTRLIAQAVDFARAQGCRRITVLTDTANAAAQRFYARHGFHASPMMPMRLRIE